jgi:hypothetical protein
MDKLNELQLVANRVRGNVPDAIVKINAEVNLVIVNVPKNRSRTLATFDVSDTYVTRFNGFDEKYVYLAIDLDMKLIN